jgi:peptidoglycan/xylan/chitin deacetylase (PgdA/CDA1 family)
MLKALKRSVLHAMKATGAFRIARSTRWRQNRLLILCYHGISLDDEHHWNPNLYMPRAALDQRFALLEKNGCHVLPLDEALGRLYDRDLPPNSVALTFDDGNFDFYHRAFPLLKRYGLPATVYLTTWYAEHDLPVFDPACHYLLWKGRGAVLDGRTFGIPQKLDLRTPAGIDRARWTLIGHTRRFKLDGEAKDMLLRKLAEAVRFDYAEFGRKRLFHLLPPARIRELAAAGVDFQLHTHRHSTPDNRDLFLREVRDNLERIRALTGRNPRHFCYPSGVYKAEFLPWLRELSIISATTCDPGLCSPDSDPLLLPRLVDHCGLHPVEFEGWLSGCAQFLPRRKPG